MKIHCSDFSAFRTIDLCIYAAGKALNTLAYFGAKHSQTQKTKKERNKFTATLLFFYQKTDQRFFNDQYPALYTKRQTEKPSMK